ncbi:hypothetical protein M9458_021689, partial [Cirrhinus mrigala]
AGQRHGICPGMNLRERNSSGEHLRSVDATYERLRPASKVKIYVRLSVSWRGVRGMRSNDEEVQNMHIY